MHNIALKPSGGDTFCPKGSMVALLTMICVGFAVSEFRHAGELEEYIPAGKRGKLGGEQGAVAISIRQGKGFANPFGRETGPTAWVPPVPVLSLAVLFWIVDDVQEYVPRLMLIVNAASVFLAGGVVVRLLQRWRCEWIGLGLYGIFLLFNYHAYFQSTTNRWVVLLSLVSIIAFGVRTFAVDFSLSRSLIWGLVGGVTALSAPTAAIGWTAVTLGALRRRLRRSEIAAAFGVAVAVASPWIIRNRIVLDGWYPIKSNASFELWLAQTQSHDGVLHGYVFQYHPLTASNPQAVMYDRVGEREFLNIHRRMAFQSIWSAPVRYASRVMNRFIEACVWTSESESDLLMTQRWWGRIIYPLPLASCLLLLLSDKKSSYVYRISAITYIGYLTPYILVSYYSRYAAALVPVQALLVTCGIHHLLHQLRATFPMSCSLREPEV